MKIRNTKPLVHCFLLSIFFYFSNLDANNSPEIPTVLSLPVTVLINSWERRFLLWYRAHMMGHFNHESQFCGSATAWEMWVHVVCAAFTILKKIISLHSLCVWTGRGLAMNLQRTAYHPSSTGSAQKPGSSHWFSNSFVFACFTKFATQH